LGGGLTTKAPKARRDFGAEIEMRGKSIGRGPISGVEFVPVPDD